VSAQYSRRLLGILQCCSVVLSTDVLTCTCVYVFTYRWRFSVKTSHNTICVVTPQKRGTRCALTATRRTSAVQICLVECPLNIELLQAPFSDSARVVASYFSQQFVFSWKIEIVGCIWRGPIVQAPILAYSTSLLFLLSQYESMPFGFESEDSLLT
jgi:hypothetical protein